jgi:hypothetical protein
MLTTILVIAAVGGFGYFIYTRQKKMNAKPTATKKSTGASRTKTTSNVAKKPSRAGGSGKAKAAK